MKQPIKAEDIRKGDLIRCEWSREDGAAREFRASHDGDTLGLVRGPLGAVTGFSGADRFYLLDRPKPAVELPTEPTLGWALFRDDRKPCLAVWQESGLYIEASCEHGVRTGGIGDGLIAFTLAVAVPAEALEELRKLHNDPAVSRCAHVSRFLAAVDEANGAAS